MTPPTPPRTYHSSGGYHGVVMLLVDRHTTGHTGVVAVPQQLGGQARVVRTVSCSDSDNL